MVFGFLPGKLNKILYRFIRRENRLRQQLLLLQGLHFGFNLLFGVLCRIFGMRLLLLLLGFLPFGLEVGVLHRLAGSLHGFHNRMRKFVLCLSGLFEQLFFRLDLGLLYGFAN